MEFLQFQKALMNVKRPNNIKINQILYNKEEKKQKLLNFQKDHLNKDNKYKYILKVRKNLKSIKIYLLIVRNIIILLI